MFDSIKNVLKQKNILCHLNQDINVCTVKDQHEGIKLAQYLLHALVDRKTALYLSGGRTPKSLYVKLVEDEQLLPGAVGMVDERYGQKFHSNSNEKMIRDTGLLRYFEIRNIPFDPILQAQHSREETAQLYDEKLRSLHATFQKSLAILGIGADGHTAGLPAKNSELKIQNLNIYTTYDLMTEFYDTSGYYGERITMTFMGLSMLDSLVVLVFGEDKKRALALMFEDGSEEEVPARFYKRPEIAKKTILITDQQV